MILFRFWKHYSWEYSVSFLCSNVSRKSFCQKEGTRISIARRNTCPDHHFCLEGLSGVSWHEPRSSMQDRVHRASAARCQSVPRPAHKDRGYRMKWRHKRQEGGCISQQKLVPVSLNSHLPFPASAQPHFVISLSFGFLQAMKEDTEFSNQPQRQAGLQTYIFPPKTVQLLNLVEHVPRHLLVGRRIWVYFGTHIHALSPPMPRDTGQQTEHICTEWTRRTMRHTANQKVIKSRKRNNDQSYRNRFLSYGDKRNPK